MSDSTVGGASQYPKNQDINTGSSSTEPYMDTTARENAADQQSFLLSAEISRLMALLAVAAIPGADVTQSMAQLTSDSGSTAQQFNAVFNKILNFEASQLDPSLVDMARPLYIAASALGQAGAALDKASTNLNNEKNNLQGQLNQSQQQLQELNKAATELENAQNYLNSAISQLNTAMDALEDMPQGPLAQSYEAFFSALLAEATLSLSKVDSAAESVSQLQSSTGGTISDLESQIDSISSNLDKVNQASSKVSELESKTQAGLVQVFENYEALLSAAESLQNFYATQGNSSEIKSLMAQQAMNAIGLNLKAYGQFEERLKRMMEEVQAAIAKDAREVDQRPDVKEQKQALGNEVINIAEEARTQVGLLKRHPLNIPLQKGLDGTVAAIKAKLEQLQNLDD